MGGEKGEHWTTVLGNGATREKVVWDSHSSHEEQIMLTRFNRLEKSGVEDGLGVKQTTARSLGVFRSARTMTPHTHTHTTH